MRVLKNTMKNEEKSYPRKITCCDCGSELEYDEDDLTIGTYGCTYVKCPVCGYDNMLDDDEHCITLTKDNIEFPTHFEHSDKDNCSENLLKNKYVKNYINRGIAFLRASADEYYWFCACGNLFVVVFKNSVDEEYNVIVTGDYYEAYIPFESEDYDD